MMQLRSIIHTFENPEYKEDVTDRLVSVVTSNMEYEWINLISVLERRAPGPPMKVSFLAKRLLSGSHKHEGFNAVLATPRYVAMEE